MAGRQTWHGDGRIVQRGPSFQVLIWIGGRRVRKQYQTRDDAEEALRALRRERLEAAVLPRSPQPTVTYAEAIRDFERWLETSTDRVRTPRTLQSYTNQLRAVEEWWGPRRVMSTRKHDVENWVEALREAKFSTSTIRHLLDRLSQLHKHCVRREWLAVEPCRVERPRMIVSSERKPLADDVLEALEDACSADDPRERALFLLAADAGLRRDEIGRLQGEDIRFGDDGAALGWVRVAVRSEHDRTKSGRHRDVPILTPELKDALEALGPVSGRLLFAPIHDGDGIDNLARKVWERAGLGNRCELHCLRHRWVTKLLEAGAAPVQVMTWAGHRDLTTTMRYTHASPNPPAGLGVALRAPHEVTHAEVVGGTTPPHAAPHRGRKAARKKTLRLVK